MAGRRFHQGGATSRIAGHDSPGPSLTADHDAIEELNRRWWDWQADRWDGSGLRLIADNDLTYHHSVEVTFTDVVWVACADLFHHPVLSPPAPSGGLPEDFVISFERPSR